uniref:RING-type domain-containing protein n=1 Tax=Angiostrongylus cantonensis TaxID=6313 RepID=A0A0K0DPN3_ANGCA
MNDCSNGRLVSFFIQGDDVISCEVCLEPFQIPSKPPKILPCGHNFCDQCLFSLCCHQQYYLLDSIKCPTCHRTFPTNVAIEAPTNWELCKILENVRQGREMNVTVIHVPDKPTTMLPSSTSAGPSEKRRPETTERKSGAILSRMQHKGNHRTLIQIFYCLECCVNSHNGHAFLTLSELQTEQLKVLGELRELRRKVIQTFRLPATTSGDVRENSVGEGELSDALTSLDNAIQLPCQPRTLFNNAARHTSRRQGSSPTSSTSAFHRGSVVQNKKFSIFAIVYLYGRFPINTHRIAHYYFSDIPLEQLSVFADALLQCFHQANILSKKSGPISKTVSRKTIWKYVQMSYTELLRLGAKNYLSHEPERLALLDDLAYLCYIFSDVCDQATVTICMIEAARARVASGTLSDQDQQKTAQRLKVIDEHLLECRRVQKLQDLRTTKTKKTVKLKQLWKFFFRRSKSRA